MSSVRLLARTQGRVVLAALRPLAVAARGPAPFRSSPGPHRDQAAPTLQGRAWGQLLQQSARPLHTTPMAAMSSEDNNISSELMEKMRGKIASALETDMVEVKDMQGDGRHVEITVISKLFDGKSSVNRQRMVYKAIWEELQETVHAVDAMVTRTPEEAGV